jgi:hypothetical protein
VRHDEARCDFDGVADVVYEEMDWGVFLVFVNRCGGIYSWASEECVTVELGGEVEERCELGFIA